MWGTTRAAFAISYDFGKGCQCKKALIFSTDIRIESLPQTISTSSADPIVRLNATMLDCARPAFLISVGSSDPLPLCAVQSWPFP
jgi:hypothetical protein